jgi:hypothetical protein
MKKGGWKRKLGYRLLILFILTPLLAFGISNLFLVSPKGRAFIEHRIERKLPLEASVQGATWSPWNGITIYGLQMEQPGALKDAVGKPLLSVQSIQLHPYWTAFAGMNFELKSIEILKPEITLPIELLSQIPQKEAKAAVALKTPDLASLEPQPGGGSGPSRAPVSPPLGEIDLPAGKKPAGPTVSVVEIPSASLWVKVSEGRLTIVTTMSSAPLFQANGINGSLPLAGKSAESEVHVARLEGIGGIAPTDTTLPIKWTPPILATGAIGGKLSGLEYKVQGHIGLVPGMPFRIDALIPEQKEKEFSYGDEIRATLGSVVAQGSSHGYLGIPASWQSQVVVQAAPVDTSIGGRETRFDSGHALFVFQDGALRCLDARLVSEGASIIGNATLLSDTRMAANARIIATPETLLSIAGYTRRDQRVPHLTPLSTPQRAALDLQLFGHLGNISYKPDPLAEPVPLQ